MNIRSAFIQTHVQCRDSQLGKFCDISTIVHAKYPTITLLSALILLAIKTINTVQF